MSKAISPGSDSLSPSDLRKKLEYWLQVAPVLLHSIDANGCFVAVTDYWLARLGYTKDEIIGRHSSDLLTPQSRQYAAEHVLPRLFKLGYIENVEYQVVCKSGEIIDVVLSAVLDESNFEGRRETISVMTDVTDRKRIERKLDESEKLYRSLIQNQTELVSMARPDGQLIFVNDAYARLYNQAPASMIGRNLFEFVPADAHDRLREHFDQVLQSQQMIQTENQVLMPDGARRWISWTNLTVGDQDGHPIAIHSVGRDIEQRVEDETKLKDSEARYRLLADNGTDMVFQLDMDLVRRYVSPACREILGYEPEELIGIKPVNMAHPEDAPRLQEVYRSLLAGEADRQMIVNRIRHRDGHWVWVEARFRLLKDPETGASSGIIGALRDITERKLVEEKLAEANRQLEALALLDDLTGLSNRRSFNLTIDRETRRARREKQDISLLMIDVDFFKQFNDLYGHAAGDECLRGVAEAIQAAIRRPADIAARYGGEEFAVVLPNTSRIGAGAVAATILETLARVKVPHASSDTGFVTVSIGIATWKADTHHQEPMELLHRADRALYQAKAAGRHTIVHFTADAA